MFDVLELSVATLSCILISSNFHRVWCPLMNLEIEVLLDKFISTHVSIIMGGPSILTPSGCGLYIYIYSIYEFSMQVTEKLNFSEIFLSSADHKLCICCLPYF